MQPSARTPHARARQGGWEEAYLDALARGHTKATAAAMAGCSLRTPYARAERDPDFCERQEIACGLGLAALERIAFARITAVANPSDRMLCHLLTMRTPNEDKVARIASGEPQCGQARASAWLEYCTLEEKQAILDIAERATARAREHVAQ
jgi:hypothetical protein